MSEALNALSKDGLYYLASPYSSNDPYIRERRYLDVLKIGADLTTLGLVLIEPIAMSHHQAQRFNLPTGYDFWQHRDRRFIDLCCAVIICTLDGWQESVGVRDEIAYAHAQGKPVYYLNPDRLELTVEP